MKLTRVADLVGQDIAGLRADVRSFNADGALRYEHTEKEGPRMVTMTKAYYRHEKACPTLARMYGKDRLRWLRWEWDGRTAGISAQCGYSGVVAEDNERLDYYIMLETRAMKGKV